jgi:hypothetical protein
MVAVLKTQARREELKIPPFDWDKGIRRDEL